MKIISKERVILSILGAGLILGTQPIVSNAYTVTRGNITYTYDSNDELVSAKFREGQLVADVAGSATTKYTPKYYYQQSNLTRKVSSDIYGQKYSYLLPDGYNQSSLREHQDAVYHSGCFVNDTATKGGHFKIYSQKYISGGGCVSSSYTSGGNSYYNGASGEWRILGYNSYGDSSVENPVFPADWPPQTLPNAYPWLSGSGNVTTFDKLAYRDEKQEAVRGAMQLYGLTGDVSTWVDRLSLQTDPTSDTPVFRGKRAGGYYRTIHAPTNPSLTRDLSVTKFEVCYGNEVIGVFTRDSSGNVKYDIRKNVASENTYTFKVTIKNSNDADMDSSQLKAYLGYALGENAEASDQLTWFDKNIANYEITGRKLKRNESIELTKDIKISTLKTNNRYRATAVIDKLHYTRRNPDSTDKSNDWGKLVFSVDNGNMSAVNTQLIDEKGNVVNHAPIPGVKYKVRYNYKYTGPDRDSNFNLEIKNTVVRTLNNDSTDTYTNTVYKTLNSPSNGDTFYVETPYLMFETSKAQASSKLTQNELIDSNANDNSTSASYSDNYDITVQNVRIYPKKEMPTTFPSKIKVGIKYDVVVTAPSYVPYFELDVVTQINSNTSFVDHVKKGVTKDITREIEVTVNGTGSLPATVHVNKPAITNERIWESNYNNNQGSTANTVNSDGSNGNLVITAPEDPSKGGCTLSGIKNNVNFNKKHNINNYNGNYIANPLYKNSDKVVSTGGFYKYGSGNSSDSNRNYNESYKIEQILFKSKLTTDLGLGNDGWVDLKNNIGQIKAGYGYDLKIIVNYNTNAITSQPNIVQNPANPLKYHGNDPKNVPSTSNGTFVTDRNVMANVPKDIYVKTSDGKVLSASGIYGTTKAFTSRELSNNNNGIKVEYTLKNNSKIYIDEATKDGKYGLSVFTPNVSGISGQNLCDKNNVQIEVKGSMLDDNNDHIIQ